MEGKIDTKKEGGNGDGWMDGWTDGWMSDRYMYTESK